MVRASPSEVELALSPPMRRRFVSPSTYVRDWRSHPGPESGSCLWNPFRGFGIRSCGTTTHRYIRNLHSDVEFTNVVTRKGGDKADFWSSWIDRAEQGDPHARLMTQKYTFRPAEELYNVASDPHCLQNLVDDPALTAVKNELAAQLDSWMLSQGDKGAETEAIAHTRKAGFREAPVP